MISSETILFAARPIKVQAFWSRSALPFESPPSSCSPLPL